MKRSLSLLLALVMVFAMIPATTVTAVVTEDVTVQAYQTAGNRLVEVDGEVKEVFWLLDTPVGSSVMGALCDIQNIYFAFKTSAATAEVMVNGKTVDCTLGASPTASVGTIAGKDGVYELCVPAKELNLAIEPETETYFSVTLGADTVEGTLVLADTAVTAVNSGIKLTGADYSASLNTSASDTTGNMTVSEDGVFTFKNDSESYYKITSKTTSQWASLSGNGFMLSFEADFNDLPTSSDSTKPMYNFGLFWYIIAGAARHDMAFWADEDDQIMFAVKQSTVADARNNALGTGIYLDTDEAQNVRVRILLDQSNNITLYINGVKIGTLDACPPPSTSAGKQFCIYVDHRKKTSDRVVDVTWSDLVYQDISVAEIKSAEDKVTYPAPTGSGVKDIEAFITSGSLKIDGTAEDAQWYLNHRPDKRTGSEAPSLAVGVLWDNDNLYLGMQDLGKQNAKQMTLTVGSKLAGTADLAAGTATVGEFFTDPYMFTAEWAIPMSALDLKGQLGETCQYTLTVTGAGGTSALSGTLTLGGNAVVMGDTFDDLATKNYVVTGSAPGTQMVQGEGSANYVSNPDLAGNEIHQMFKAVDFDGSAYSFEMDVTFQSLPSFTASLGWRGFCIEIREPKLQTRFNFRDDGSGKIVMDILYLNNYETRDTGLTMGDRAVVRMDVDKNDVITMFVNDREVAEFPPQNRTQFTINDTYPMPRVIIQATNYNRVADKNGSLNEVNVQIHDLLWSQPLLSDPQMRLEKALEQLSEKAVLAGNSDADNITSALNLPASVALSSEMVYPVTWTVTGLDGAASKVIDTKTGAVSAAAGTSVVLLTASIRDGEQSAQRSFSLQVKGTQVNDKVYFLTNDDVPATGAVDKPAADVLVTFDTDHNSVVYDQGSAKRFNRIVLCDSDETSRVSQNDLGVFVSNDGKTFTKVNGWLLHQSGRVYTLYNLDQTARYVKVHTYLDGLNDPADPMKFAPSFQNSVVNLIQVEYTDNLLGAKGKFAHTGSYTAANSTDKELRDEIVRITLEQLGAKSGEYRSDCADFRFTAGGKQLPHWYDGEGSFYVRVLTIPAKGNTAVTAHWGNVSAGDVADREAVFEAVYGNVSLIDLTEKTDLVNSGRAFTFPNGTIIAVSRNDDGGLTAIYSYDGGRTFTPKGVDLIPNGHYANNSGFGSFIWDEANQRLILMAYAAKVKSDDYYQADCRFVYMHTDDYGKTWSEPRVLSDAAAFPATANDVIIQNSQGRLYQLSYCDGLTLKEADGKGPNVDYVLTHSYIRKDGTMAGAAIFSKDGGENWIASEGSITMDTAIGHENGISETAFAQLDDGSLYIVARAQEDDNTYFYESYSYDCGNTWTQGVPSKVISTNTSPVFLPYGSDRLLMWAGNNTLGGNARRRFPLTLAISGDNYKTYDRSVNLTLGTAYDTLEASIEHITQPSLSLSPDGSEAFACWSNLRQSTSVAMLMEEFGDMIYHTKGAYDAFESTAIKGEGWLLGDHYATGYNLHVGGQAEVSGEQANNGGQSMKLVDDNSSLPAYVLRQIPSMRKGTVGASLYVPSTNTSDYAFEIKHAYNYTYGEFTMAGFAVKPDGTVYLCDGKDTVVGKVAPNSWNDFAIEFDMLGSKKGTLYINDKQVADFDLIIQSDRVTVVEICETKGSATRGSCVYVDDFYATEAELVHNGTRTPAVRNAKADPVSFNDVASGDWYAQAVSYATENGLMSGYNATTFGANDTLTRAQVVQVLYNKEGTPALNGATHKFPDVPADQWFNNAVTWGAAKKVVSGYGDGRFGPNDTVTLEQAAVILWNYSGTPTAEASLDAIGSHSDWAANALRWAVKTGLFEGMPYGSVTNGATRAQTAQMLMNYLSK